MNIPIAHRTILDEAAEIVAGARQKAYGAPKENFQRIAALWTAYLNCSDQGTSIEVAPHDVAHMMILLKMARLMTDPNHRDSQVDMAGYTACLEML